MPAEPKDITKRYERLRTNRANFDARWTEIGEYIVPWRRLAIERQFTQGDKRTEKIFDGTAPQALTTAASAVHGTLTPSTVRWFGLAMRDSEVNDIQPVAEWLEDATQRILSAFGQSNFDSEMQEVDVDLLAFGTACIFLDEQDPLPGQNFTGFRFRTYPPGSYAVGENADGLVDTVFVEFQLSAIAAADKWGMENLSDGLKKRIDSGHGDELVSFLHAVEPRTDARISSSLNAPPTERAFRSVILEYGANEKKVVRESGYHELPYMVPRWRKISGETYGRGPGMDILPDVRTLNQAVELRLKAWLLAVAPPIKTRDRGVIGDVRLRPFGRTYVRDMQAIEAFDIGSKFDVSNFQEEQIRAAIRAGLFVDQIQFPPQQGTPVSATEAGIRFETMQRILGPTVSRLQAELLGPLVDRAFNIMFRRGALSELPDELLAASEAGRGIIDVVYEGPLARAQRATDVEAINRFAALAFPLAEARPEILDNVNFDEMVRGLGDAVSLPARFLHDERAVARIREARRQAEEQAAQMDQLAQAGEIVANVAPVTQNARESDFAGARR